MDKFSIEDKIRARLQSHEEPVDKEALYAALGIVPKRRKKALILLLFSGLTIAIFLTSWYYFGEYEVVASPMSEVPSTEVDATKSSEKPVEISTVPAQTSSIETDNVKESTVAAPHLERWEEQTNGVEVPAEIPVEIKVDNHLNSFEGKMEVEEIITPQFTMLEINKEKKVDPEAERLQVSTVSDIMIPRHAMTWLDQRTKAVLFPIQLELPEKPIQLPKKEMNQSDYFMRAYASYDRFNSNYTVNSELGTLHAALREESERALDYVSVGIDFNKYISDRFYLGTGLEVGQYHYEFKYQESFTQQGQDTGIVQIDVNYLGDSTFMVGSYVAEEEVIRKWTVYNQLQMIHVPLHVGFQQSIRQWDVFVESGLVLGLRMRYVGQLFNQAQELAPGQALYGLRPSFWYQGAIGLNYRINRQSACSLRLRYRQSLNALSAQSDPVKEYVQQIGIQGGYVYRF